MKLTKRSAYFWMCMLVCAYMPMWFVSLSGSRGKIGLIFFCIGLLFFMICLTHTLYIKRNDYNEDFYKTLEELQKERQEASNEWHKAHRFMKIIGEHEAIKMWNENKNKQNENIL